MPIIGENILHSVPASLEPDVDSSCPVTSGIPAGRIIASRLATASEAYETNMVAR